MSKNTSPSDGGGSWASPRRGSSGTGGRSCQSGWGVAEGLELQPGLVRGAARTPGRTSRRGRRAGPAAGQRGQGRDPASSRRRTCPRLMPATRLRWSDSARIRSAALFPAAPAPVEPGVRQCRASSPLELEERPPELAVVVEEVAGRERPLVALAEDEHRPRRAGSRAWPRACRRRRRAGPGSRAWRSGRAWCPRACSGTPPQGQPLPGQRKRKSG